MQAKKTDVSHSHIDSKSTTDKDTVATSGQAAGGDSKVCVHPLVLWWGLVSRRTGLTSPTVMQEKEEVVSTCRTEPTSTTGGRAAAALELSDAAGSAAPVPDVSGKNVTRVDGEEEVPHALMPKMDEWWTLNGGLAIIGFSPEEWAIQISRRQAVAEQIYAKFRQDFQKDLVHIPDDTLLRMRDGRYLLLVKKEMKARIAAEISTPPPASAKPLPYSGPGTEALAQQPSLSAGSMATAGLYHSAQFADPASTSGALPGMAYFLGGMSANDVIDPRQGEGKGGGGKGGGGKGGLMPPAGGGQLSLQGFCKGASFGKGGQAQGLLIQGSKGKGAPGKGKGGRGGRGGRGRGGGGRAAAFSFLGIRQNSEELVGHFLGAYEDNYTSRETSRNTFFGSFFEYDRSLDPPCYILSLTLGASPPTPEMWTFWTEAQLNACPSTREVLQLSEVNTAAWHQLGIERPKGTVHISNNQMNSYGIPHGQANIFEMANPKDTISVKEYLKDKTVLNMVYDDWVVEGTVKGAWFYYEEYSPQWTTVQQATFLVEYLKKNFGWEIAILDIREQVEGGDHLA